jgi:hypothetical protein
MSRIQTLLLSALGAALVAAPPDGTILRIRTVSGAPVATDVYVEGRGPYSFLLDTGSETSLIDERLARELSITQAFQTELITPAGRRNVHGTYLRKVKLGPVQASNQEFLLTDVRRWGMLPPDVQGLLGQPFLSMFDYTLDFRHRKIIIGTRLFDGAHFDKIPFRRVESRLAIQTSEGEMILDSGAGSLLLFRAGPGTPGATIQDFSGAAHTVQVGPGPKIWIGGRLYQPREAVYGAAGGEALNGLLPASLFPVVYVSNSEGYIAVEAGEAPRR